MRGDAPTRWEHPRHEPEKTVLYGVVAEHLETFLAATRADPGRAGLPPFVERERKYLDCGILESSAEVLPGSTARHAGATG